MPGARTGHPHAGGVSLRSGGPWGDRTCWEGWGVRVGVREVLGGGAGGAGGSGVRGGPDRGLGAGAWAGAPGVPGVRGGSDRGSDRGAAGARVRAG
ncbi:hypothetical protein GCM10027073_28570 [Streptomyces chlorus]